MPPRLGSTNRGFTLRSFTFDITISRRRDLAEHAYFFLNALLFIVAAIFLVFGIYVVAQRGNEASNSLAVPAWGVCLLFIVGMVLIVCGTLGCLFIYKDRFGSNWFASLYVSMMLAVVFAHVYSAGALLSAKSDLSNDLSSATDAWHEAAGSSFLETLDATWKDAYLADPRQWKQMQDRRLCCGYDAPSAYRASIGYGIDYMTGSLCKVDGGVIPFSLDPVWTEVRARMGPGNPKNDEDIEHAITGLGSDTAKHLIGASSFYCKKQMENDLLDSVAPVVTASIILLIIELIQVCIFCGLVCLPLPVEYGDMDGDGANSGMSISRALASHRYLPTDDSMVELAEI